ncbi:MAG: amidohydrolase family protein [Christensenellales bacterium]|jgi:predicted TIM-barrel fold metal-dependent hydrolase
MTFKAQDFRIINSHTHIFPQKIADKASEAIGDFYGIPMHFPGEAQMLIEDGKPFGIEKYLICSTATIPHQVQSINDFIHSQCREHSEFIGFASLHPAMENMEGEVERIISLGLRGIKLHSDFQKFDIDAESAMPMYALAARHGLPILFHMGDARYEYSRPHKLLKVARRFPDLICIGAHFGGYQRWDEAYDLLRLENIFLDTSSSLDFISRETARDFINNIGEDKFFFGTDFPMWTHEGEIKHFLGLDLTKRQYEKIFFENFAKLMGIE